MYQIQRNHPKQPGHWTSVPGTERETEEECKELAKSILGPFNLAVVPVPVPISENI